MEVEPERKRMLRPEARRGRDILPPPSSLLSLSSAAHARAPAAAAAAAAAAPGYVADADTAPLAAAAAVPATGAKRAPAEARSVEGRGAGEPLCIHNTKAWFCFACICMHMHTYSCIRRACRKTDPTLGGEGRGRKP